MKIILKIFLGNFQSQILNSSIKLKRRSKFFFFINKSQMSTGIISQSGVANMNNEIYQNHSNIIIYPQNIFKKIKKILKSLI